MSLKDSIVNDTAGYATVLRRVADALDNAVSFRVNGKIDGDEFAKQIATLKQSATYLQFLLDSGADEVFSSKGEAPTLDQIVDGIKRTIAATAARQEAALAEFRNA